MPTWTPTAPAPESAPDPAPIGTPPAEPEPAQPAAAGAGGSPELDRTIFVDSTAVAGNAAAAAPEAPPQAEGELVIASGPDSGHTYRVSGPSIRIGRAPDNDLVLRDPATSGHHARVERRGTAFYVVDLGSTNGTLVNGEVVMERELKDGDSITIGQNAVTFAIR
jgi:pSer/pThr/pTyr-binding forkhead associated (FHA) protein